MKCFVFSGTLTIEVMFFQCSYSFSNAEEIIFFVPTEGNFGYMEVCVCTACNSFPLTAMEVLHKA